MNKSTARWMELRRAAAEWNRPFQIGSFRDGTRRVSPPRGARCNARGMAASLVVNGGQDGPRNQERPMANQNECRCANKSCGCVKAESCTCGNGCACKKTCTCGKNCSCSAAK